MPRHWLLLRCCRLLWWSLLCSSQCMCFRLLQSLVLVHWDLLCRLLLVLIWSHGLLPRCCWLLWWGLLLAHEHLLCWYL